MWFRIVLPEFPSSPLAALIGRDGQVYWRALDIGKILGKKDTYWFAKRHGGQLYGKDVLDHGTVSTKKTVLLETMEALQLIHKHQPWVAKVLAKALTEGKAIVGYAYSVGTSFRSSPLLRIDYENGSSLNEWINNYARAVLQVRREYAAEEDTLPTQAADEETLPTQAAEEPAQAAEVETVPTPAAEEDTLPAQVPNRCELYSWDYPRQLRGWTVYPGEWVMEVQGRDTFPKTVWLLVGDEMKGYILGASIETIVGRRS